MKITELTCPSCGASGKKELPEQVCISQNPKIKEQLLSGAFFEWECPSCAERFFFEDVFLYNDDENKFMVYLITGTQKKLQKIPTPIKYNKEYDTDTSILRLTSSYIDFVEKIRILQAGLDDRVIEAMKAVYAQAYHQSLSENIYNMLFEEVGEDGKLSFAILLEKDDFAVDIPYEAYEQALKDFTPMFEQLEEDAFTAVDQTWLMQMLQKNGLAQ